MKLTQIRKMPPLVLQYAGKILIDPMLAEKEALDGFVGECFARTCVIPWLLCLCL